MTSQTVEFYENRITIFANNRIAEFLRIPEEEVSAAAASFLELSESYAVPVEDLASALVWAIQKLMEEYLRPSNFVTHFRASIRLTTRLKKEQKKVAQDVWHACEFYRIALLSRLAHPQFEELCIDNIKRKLELGLFAPNLNPLDEYPKLVKAIANKTAGLEGWAFSSAAVEKLGIESNSTELRM